MEKELRDREERLERGQHLFEWMETQVNAGKITLDENGRPNIIRNQEDVDFDDANVH